MRRQTDLIWGLIAVALAAWWGARTLGVIPLGLDDLIQRALPALIILMGLNLLLRRRIPLSGAFALILTVIVVGGVGYTAYSSRSGQLRTDNQQIFEQPINTGLTLLRVRVLTLATDVEILAGTSANRVMGTFLGSSDNSVTVTYQEAGDGSATLTLLESRRSGEFPLLEMVGRGTLEIELPTSIPMDIEFGSDEGSVVLNLGGTELERLNVTAENGDLVVTLPDYDPAYSQPDDLLGTLTAANGDLAIFIPLSVAAQLELNFAGSGIAPQYDGERYDYLIGDILQAFDFRTADKVVRYALTAPRGQIRVETSG